MAGNDIDVSVENHEFGKNPANQCIIVAPAVVGPSDGPGKEGVAAEQNLFLPFKEAHPSRSMSRCGNDFEPEVSDLYDV